MVSASLPPKFQPQTLRQYIASYEEIACDAQAVLWDALLDMMMNTTFPYHQHIFETGRELPLVDCEAAMHLCDTDLLHKPVSRILDVIGKDQGVTNALSCALGPKPAVNTANPSLELGHYVFSTHRNQLNDSGRNATDGRPEAQEMQVEEGEAQGTPSLHITYEFVEQQFRAGPTDGFCNFKGDARNDGRPPMRCMLFAYELKAPHKLHWGVIERAGLASNATTLDLRQDVWERSNRNEDAHDEDAMSHDGEGEDPFFATTGVIIQLYDFMIRKQTSSAHESSTGRESTADKSFHPSTASPTSRGSAADDLGRSHCTKRKCTPEDDRAAEHGDVDSSKRPKLQNANDQIDDTAKPSLDARSLPTPPPANSSLASSPGKQSFSTHIRIDRVPCCTTKCILGVVRGGPRDPGCLNTHGDQHPSAKVFRQTLHDQLTQSPYEDYMEIYMSGSTGSLFKVRLGSLGYVILAKAAKHAARGALHY
ncbi:hypothetical protein LA080_013574 [Diaporthe eres]|nr:hypothetical protein LA080_013574 [Diaporthe eres]